MAPNHMQAAVISLHKGDGVSISSLDDDNIDLDLPSR